MKKHLAAALLAATVPALWVTPAGAAVPSKPAKVTVPCPGGQGVARIWFQTSLGRVTKLAADNPCDQWLGWGYGGRYASGAWHNLAQVAPGAHFNWGQTALRSWASGISFAGPPEFSRSDWCGEATVHLIYGYRDVRSC